MLSSLLRGGMSAVELRDRWQQRSLASGWAFPSDWYTPAVDAVCEALSERHRDTTDAAAARLGRDRARAGVSLEETLADIDALTEVVRVPPVGVWRVASVGWAETGRVRHDAVRDGLTGLASAEYLHVRCGEVYRGAEAEGSSASATHALVVARLEGGDARWWGQVPMVLVAESMRAVFAGGQSLARIGPTVAAALVERRDVLGRRVRALSELMTARVRVDADADARLRVWIERLPRDAAMLPDLLSDLAR